AGLVLLFAAASNLFSADTTAKPKPVLLYSRYYNAAGENRYAPDGVYKEVLQRLRAEFDVRIHNQPVTPRTLAGVNFILIANPNYKAAGTNPPPPHVSPADIDALTECVRTGGGLMPMENQDHHSL